MLRIIPNLENEVLTVPLNSNSQIIIAFGESVSCVRDDNFVMYYCNYSNCPIV